MTEVNAAENILQSIDIVAKKRIEQLELNKIVVCRIIDISHRSKGEYGVEKENVTYKAYSDAATYSLNERVYVLIPNGDFNETKFIIGRKR